MLMLFNSLFHYTSLATFIEYILPSKKLKFSKIKNSRDPYEYQSFDHRYLDEDSLSNDTIFLEFLQCVKNFKLDSQFLCFSLPDTVNIGKEPSYLRFGYDRPKLWESYGDKHKGVCIGFDKSKIESQFSNNIQNDEFCYRHREIDYKDIVSGHPHKTNSLLSNLYHEYLGPNCKELILKNEKTFFFQKDYDYKDENEYRFVAITNKEQEEIKIDISDAVTDIYFGDLVPSDFLNFYHDLIKKEFPSSSYQQVKWFNGKIITINYQDRNTTNEAHSTSF